VLERLKTLFTSLVGLDPGKILPTVRISRHAEACAPSANQLGLSR
jgi:hypothetical protein